MPRQTVHLGIDQSYTGFAVAVYQLGGNHDVFLWDHSKAKAGSGVDRLLKIEDQLHSLLKRVDKHADIAHVAIEGYSHASKTGRELAGELGYAVKRTLRQCLPAPQAYPTVVTPTAVKKFCLGAGAGRSKALMLKGVLQKWDVDVDDDNMADAYTLARIAACYQHPERAPLKYEQEVLEKLTWHTELDLTENPP